MKIQVSNNGKTIEGKTIYLFGNGIAEMNTETRGEKYLAILLTSQEPLSNVLRNHEKHEITMYFYNKIIYIDVAGDKYHYILNLNSDPTQLSKQIENDKVALFGILSEDESSVEYSIIEDIIIE
ncbi:hypothetical protein L0Z36_26150 [Burkholderia multivorans]|uniref:hypothetical protein n=1 Tax=Burkholderia multivorans TaxID=87883 RepID=UPI0020196BA9|nr:hypothetical protein [Burkholderia multivorans]UQP02902.1 hypothetical protein L0Z36_26150 [Burkholderia multivorans]